MRGKEVAEILRGQRGPVAQHQGRHHRIADLRVGHGVDGNPVDRRQSVQNPFDRRGGQVLAVHPQPFPGAPGEVDPAIGVAVGEVAGEVHAVAEAFAGGLCVVVVTTEHSGAVGVHDLADRFVGVGQRPGGVKDGRRALGHGVRVVDRHPGKATADRTGRALAVPGDDHRSLSGAEAVPDGGAETPTEFGDVAFGRLVAERNAKRIVGVVGTLRSRQNVGQRLADVIHIRRTVTAQIIEQSRGRERRRCHRRPRRQRHRPTGHQRIGVKQRHRQIADIGRGDRKSLHQ